MRGRISSVFLVAAFLLFQVWVSIPDGLGLLLPFWLSLAALPRVVVLIAQRGASRGF